jgi:hypothetical protein
MKKTDLQKKLATIAPYVSIWTIWEHDEECRDIRKDCDGMDDEDPNDWQAWQSEVRATVIHDGEEVSASAYLGGTWEKAGDIPEESNPDISGYEPDMTREALEELLGKVECDTLAGMIRKAITAL